MALQKKFIPGQAVKVVALKQITRKISGSQGVLRQPALGDHAEVIEATNPADPALVQMVTAELSDDGKVLWRADFAADELELA
jgi:hypothetical protein